MKFLKTGIPHFLLSLTVLATSCSKKYEGEGPVVEQRREVDNVRRLALNMNAQVFVRDTTVAYCIVKAQEGIQEGIVIRMDGSALVAGTKGTISTSEPIVIEIGMTRPEGIEINGSGTVTSMNTLKNDRLDFEVNGSGKLTADIVALKVRSYVSGSGNVHLSGSTQEHRIEVSGSGNIDAPGLSTLSTGADISGSGKAVIMVAEKLDAQVVGSGVVLYSGDPTVNKRITGSGLVEKVR